MSADLEAEIRLLNSKFMLFRYLTIKIDSADVPRTTVGYDKKTGIKSTEFTPAALETIYQFMTYAVDIYNNEHPEMPTTVEESWETVQKHFKDDQQAILKEQTLPV